MRHLKERQTYIQRVFEEVLELSQQRILDRIRPPWLPQPRYITKKRQFLRDKIRTLLQKFRQYQHDPHMYDLIVKAEELVESLNVLEQPATGSNLTELIRNVVLKAAALVGIGNFSSLEKPLEFIGVDSMVSRDSAIRQIDKIARYLSVCSDFLRIARQPKSRDLFQNINILRLKSLPGCTPPGARKQCFVHAEIQQAFYYEGNPHDPPPRAIGSSQSACYLCDLFIQKQRKYQISHCHGRLYDQWTLPDLFEVTESSAAHIGNIVQSMITDIAAKSRKCGSNKGWTPFPVERRAFLPLSHSSASSRITPAPSKLSNPRNLQDESVFPRSCQLSRSPPTLPVRSINISSEDLPMLYDLQSGRQCLQASIDELFLDFDFESTSVGYLRITRTTRPPENLRTVTNVFDLPAGKEVEMPRSQNPSSIWLRHGSLFVVLEFCWER